MVISQIQGHYSCGLYPDALSMHAKHRAEELTQLIPEDKKLLLVFTGFSGISYATALAITLNELNTNVNLMFIRKPGDTSHGSPVHANIKEFNNDVFIVFVDDFIDSGATFARLQLAVQPIGPISLVCTHCSVVPANTVYVKATLSSEDKQYYGNLLTGNSNA